MSDELILDKVALDKLGVLIAEGEAVLASKCMPPAKLYGDWQVMETTYSVVQREPFIAWREQVLQWVAQHFGDYSGVYWAFFDECRVPFFLEANQGVSLLRQLKRNV